jgi:hypothetical protein
MGSNKHFVFAHCAIDVWLGTEVSAHRSKLRNRSPMTSLQMELLSLQKCLAAKDGSKSMAIFSRAKDFQVMNIF